MQLLTQQPSPTVNINQSHLTTGQRLTNNTQQFQVVLSAAQNVRLSLVRVAASSPDLLVRLDALRWANENFTPLEKSLFYNNMLPYWLDYTDAERQLYTQMAQSADMAFRQAVEGNVWHHTGVGCAYGTCSCQGRCQTSPVEPGGGVAGVGFSLDDFKQGASVLTGAAKEAAALGVSIDTYLKCTQKENWNAPFCPWNKGKTFPGTSAQPGAASQNTNAGSQNTKKDDSSDDSSDGPSPVLIGAIALGGLGFLLLLTSQPAVVPLPMQPQPQYSQQPQYRY